jgi:adenylate cyclase
MNERRAAALRLFGRSALYAFIFPVLFMVIFGAPSVGAILLAGVVSALTAGPLMGLTFGYIVPWTKRLPFLPAILVQFLSFFGFGALMFALNVLVVSAAINKAPITDEMVVRNAWAFISGPTTIQILLYGVVLFIVLVFFEQIRRKLGPGVMSSWITGKYHKPREEVRVFMFLDLKDSTPLAERLGSLEFSALVQDFFNDLGWSVMATRANVSHYIGDEAVIVWPPKTAFKDDNCVRLFFHMKQEIAKRADYYQRRYGVVPTFKAGVHIGTVVSAEVGRTKSEIVYHGDAVNTTARIVGMCATLGHDLLVSRAVADNLSDKFSKQPLGSHALKGKAEPVEIVAVND